MSTHESDPHTREWLEAHGEGSYAMGTVSLSLTRRYHGLLVAPNGHGGRDVLVSNCDEVLRVGEKSIRLTNHAFERNMLAADDVVKSFTHLPFPTWEIEADALRITRTLFAAQGEPTTVLRFEHTDGPPCVLEVRPFLALRDMHQVAEGREASHLRAQASDGHLRVLTGVTGAGPLTIAHNGELLAANDVWRGFTLAREKERGLEHTEDLLTPGLIRFKLEKGMHASIVFSLRDRDAADADHLEKLERECRADLREASTDATRDIALSAQCYRVREQNRASIVAGFPWYGTQTREALYALPGLMLTTGFTDSARELLMACADAMRGGLLPATLSETESPEREYNIDSALYFVECVRLYTEHRSSRLYIEDRLYDKVLEVISSCAEGTSYGIRSDDDGLLHVDTPHPPTWMNAVIDGRAVTPRRGKPVEIQALWHNALLVAADLAQVRGALVLASEMRGLARRVNQSFMRKFWLADRGFCADVVDAVDGPDVDARMRPNQLFASSLCYPLLSREDTARMLENVHRALVTTHGIRTLAKGDADYRAYVPASERHRHESAHQGAAWPWLVGPYCSALVYAHGAANVRTEVERVVLPLMTEALTERLTGHIAECYDAEAPQHPNGAPGYAMSLAEVLRVHAVILEGRIAPQRISAPPPALVPLAMEWLENN